MPSKKDRNQGEWRHGLVALASIVGVLVVEHAAIASITDWQKAAWAAGVFIVLVLTVFWIVKYFVAPIQDSWEKVVEERVEEIRDRLLDVMNSLGTDTRKALREHLDEDKGAHQALEDHLAVALRKHLAACG